MSLQRRSPHGQWSNRLIFIGAVCAASVGLGNVWKFPQLLAEHGGGAFLLLYLSCLLLLTVPLMAAEALLGRRGRANPYSTWKRAANEAGGSSLWAAGGALGMVTALLLVVGYGVLGGWSLAYVFRAGGGALQGMDAVGAQELFRALTSDPERMLTWMTLFVVMSAMIVGRGLRFGLEDAVRWLWPALLLTLGLLLVAAVGSGKFLAGVKLLLMPRPEQVGLAALLAALEHAFFSFGLGLGAVLVFSAYLDDRAPLLGSCAWIVGLDTLFGLLAGLALVPLLEATGQPLRGGVALGFEIMPQVVGVLRFGDWIGVGFYLLLFLCAWTSAVALMEPAVAFMVERWRLERPLAAGYAAVAVWLPGVAALLSFNLWAHLQPFEQWAGVVHATLFDALLFFAGRLLLPLCALLLVLLVGWRMARQTGRLELGGGADWHLWYGLLRFLAPPALLVIGLGAFV
ncbi:sodium-dependent transporter [Alkalilimnicola sp. S0819]|uniref:sodium-dependent transporter n=1 Tax=Alkalilimnicola sp. S0819 TaxID=2613922 RepID=UPI001261C6AF|nr:sodium-dependent transporter [Alkalilimnicola sp. S0819]KAB7627898.1 sodium-dependent transporter [Alkalilimnicola sp. S0819]MPQ15534.1 sodium-dependent transporter [Alkalilimnicola sp. S0819]